ARRWPSPNPVPIRLGLTSGPPMWHRQSDAPPAGLALPELEHAADLQRLERREPQAHAAHRRTARAARDAVVAHLHHPGTILAGDRDLHPGRLRVLVRVAD